MNSIPVHLRMRQNNYPVSKLLLVWVMGITVTVSCLAHSKCFAQSFQAKRESDRVDLLQGGKLITTYHFRSGTKPILWPLIGPDGTRMSREYPMVPDSKNEAHDHPHHRSLSMTFGEVNQVDFWAEGKGHGEVVHKEVVAVMESNAAASVQARHVWQTVAQPDSPSQPFLQELCKYTVSGTPEERIIDCEYILKHAENARKEPIHFGDTKEGMFAIRVPESMKVDKASGQIINSNGLRDGKTWGQSADWVDYNGKATLDATQDHGVAILIHPSSFGRTGYWHVRTYGLFAHNPIGVKHFLEVNPNATKKEGGYMLPPGQSMHMLYRVILHRGRWTQADGQERFKVFAQTQPQL
jgi:Methane oxygenase PmoA